MFRNPNNSIDRNHSCSSKINANQEEERMNINKTQKESYINCNNTDTGREESIEDKITEERKFIKRKNQFQVKEANDSWSMEQTKTIKNQTNSMNHHKEDEISCSNHEDLNETKKQTEKDDASDKTANTCINNLPNKKWNNKFSLIPTKIWSKNQEERNKSSGMFSKVISCIYKELVTKTKSGKEAEGKAYHNEEPNNALVEECAMQGENGNEMRKSNAMSNTIYRMEEQKGLHKYDKKLNELSKEGQNEHENTEMQKVHAIKEEAKENKSFIQSILEANDKEQEMRKRKEKRKGKEEKEYDKYSWFLNSDFDLYDKVRSTVNLCVPQIKGTNKQDDILTNMEKIANINLSDPKELIRFGKNISSGLYDDIENNVKYMKENIRKEKEKTDINKKKYDQEHTTQKIIENKQKVEEIETKYKALTNPMNDINETKIKNMQVKKEKEIERNKKCEYYLKGSMIELNGYVRKLKDSKCDIRLKNVCTRSIINMIPELRGIYQNENLCYVKDNPTVAEITKLIPEWKEDFKNLHETALENTLEMKDILRRIRNMKKDIAEISKDLQEDRSEFERLKFETLQYESNISKYDKKTKQYIKAVFKLDNVCNKLRMINNVPMDPVINHMISEHISKLMKSVEYLEPGPTRHATEDIGKVFRFEQLADTDDYFNCENEACFIFKLLYQEIFDLMEDKKEELKLLFRKSNFGTIPGGINIYKTYVEEVTKKHKTIMNKLIKQIQYTISLLFKMYAYLNMNHIKVTKIDEIYIKDFINEKLQTSPYILEKYNNSTRITEKYFMTINFTRNKPIQHPFFIYQGLDNQFTIHFINFMLDPLNTRKHRDFLQYCSIPGFNTNQFARQIINLCMSEKNLTKDGLPVSFSSAYSKFYCPEIVNMMIQIPSGNGASNHPNFANQVETLNIPLNQENEYLFTLKAASEEYFKTFVPNKTSGQQQQNSTFACSGFNLIEYIPESLTSLHNTFATFCFNYTNMEENKTLQDPSRENKNLPTSELISLENASSTLGTNSGLQNNSITKMNLFGMNNHNNHNRMSGRDKLINLFNNMDATNKSYTSEVAGPRSRTMDVLTNDHGGPSNHLFGNMSNLFNANNKLLNPVNTQSNNSSNHNLLGSVTATTLYDNMNNTRTKMNNSVGVFEFPSLKGSMMHALSNSNSEMRNLENVPLGCANTNNAQNNIVTYGLNKNVILKPTKNLFDLSNKTIPHENIITDIVANSQKNSMLDINPSNGSISGGFNASQGNSNSTNLLFNTTLNNNENISGNVNNAGFFMKNTANQTNTILSENKNNNMNLLFNTSNMNNTTNLFSSTVTNNTNQSNNLNGLLVGNNTWTSNSNQISGNIGTQNKKNVFENLNTANVNNNSTTNISFGNTNQTIFGGNNLLNNSGTGVNGMTTNFSSLNEQNNRNTNSNLFGSGSTLNSTTQANPFISTTTAQPASSGNIFGTKNNTGNSNSSWKNILGSTNNSSVNNNNNVYNGNIFGSNNMTSQQGNNIFRNTETNSTNMFSSNINKSGTTNLFTTNNTNNNNNNNNNTSSGFLGSSIANNNTGVTTDSNNVMKNFWGMNILNSNNNVANTNKTTSQLFANKSNNTIAHPWESNNSYVGNNQMNSVNPGNSIFQNKNSFTGTQWNNPPINKSGNGLFNCNNNANNTNTQGGNSIFQNSTLSTISQNNTTGVVNPTTVGTNNLSNNYNNTFQQKNTDASFFTNTFYR